MREVDGLFLHTVVRETAEAIYDYLLWNMHGVVWDVSSAVSMYGESRPCITVDVSVTLLSGAPLAVASFNVGRFVEQMRQNEWRLVMQHCPVILDPDAELRQPVNAKVLEIGFISPTGVPLYVKLSPLGSSTVPYRPNTAGSGRPTYNYWYMAVLDRNRPVRANIQMYLDDLRSRKQQDPQDNALREVRDINLGEAYEDS